METHILCFDSQGTVVKKLKVTKVVEEVQESDIKQAVQRSFEEEEGSNASAPADSAAAADSSRGEEADPATPMVTTCSCCEEERAHNHDHGEALRPIGEATAAAWEVPRDTPFISQAP